MTVSSATKNSVYQSLRKTHQDLPKAELQKKAAVIAAELDAQGIAFDPTDPRVAKTLAQHNLSQAALQDLSLASGAPTGKGSLNFLANMKMDKIHNIRPSGNVAEVKPIDPRKILTQAKDGVALVELPFAPGAGTDTIKPEPGQKAVFAVALKDGKVDFEHTGIFFQDAKGERNALPIDGWLDAQGVKINDSGRAKAFFGPFPKDLTKDLFGVDKLPKDPGKLYDVLMARGEQASQAGGKPMFDTAGAGFKGQFTIKPGSTVDLAGDSKVLVPDAGPGVQPLEVAFQGNRKLSGMRVRGTASLDLNSGGGHVTSGPSDLNMQIAAGDLSKESKGMFGDNARVINFGDSELRNFEAKADVDGKPVTLKIDKLKIDATGAPDARYMAIERAAAANFSTVPEWEAAGPDKGMLAASELMKNEGIFRNTRKKRQARGRAILRGQDGKYKLPDDFDKDLVKEFRAMKDEDLDKLITRARQHRMLENYAAIEEDDFGGFDEDNDDEKYWAGVDYKKATGRDADVDVKLHQAGEGKPRSGAAQQYNVTLGFDRKGNLGENVLTKFGPAVAAKAREQGSDTDFHVKEMTLKPGHSMGALALSNPVVQKKLVELKNDPKFMMAAGKAKKAYEASADAFGRMTQATLAGDDAALASAKADFEANRDKLSKLFVDAGGMKTDGTAEAAIAAFLEEPINEAVRMDLAPAEKVAMKDAYIADAVNNLRASIWTRQNPNFEGWEPMATNLMSEVQASGIQSKGTDSAAFKQALVKETGAKISSGNQVETLTSGPEFFGSVKDLIKNTGKGPLYVNYWAIEDDTSGSQMVDLLKEKKKQGVPVYVVVNGKTATHLGAKESLPALKEAGIPVVEWNDPDASRAPVGTHEKFIVSPQGVVTGGSNIGDHYTHAGDPETKWSDMNVRITGPATADYMKKFEGILEQSGVTPPNMDYQDRIAGPNVPADQLSDLALIEHVPMNDEQSHPITKAYMMMLQGAKPGETVRISNAYFIMSPPIREAMKAAVKNGVNVDVYTNSPDSVDEAAIGGAMLDSAVEALVMNRKLQAEAAAQGKKVGSLNIYMPKPGNPNTVHDKWAMAATLDDDGRYVDGNVSAIGTANLHARSETMEKEILNVNFNKGDTQDLNAHYNKLLSGADRLSLEHPYVQRRLQNLGYGDVIARMVVDTIF